MLKRERIIVLKTFPFRESDLIVKGLSAKGLQMSFLARGALKSKRRFAGGVLEPSSFIEVEYRPSKSLHHLKQAWILKDFHELRKDYDRLQIAFYILKTADALSLEGGEEGDSKELFSLVGNALLEAQNSSRLQTLKLFFQIKLLFLQGVLPQKLSRADILSKTLQSHQTFNMKEEEEKLFSDQADQTLNRYLHL